QQSLAERVVDFVSTRVVEVFALEINLRPAALFAEPPRVVQRRGPADVVLEQRIQLGLEGGVGLGLGIFGRKLIQCPRQPYRHRRAAEGAKPSSGVRDLGNRGHSAAEKERKGTAVGYMVRLSVGCKRWSSRPVLGHVARTLWPGARQ